MLTPAALSFLLAGRSFCLELPINSGLWPGSVAAILIFPLSLTPHNQTQGSEVL